MQISSKPGNYLPGKNKLCPTKFKSPDGSSQKKKTTIAVAASAHVAATAFGERVAAAPRLIKINKRSAIKTGGLVDDGEEFEQCDRVQ